MEKLQNSKCEIQFRPEKKDIFGQCFQDKWNLPAFYTESKRGLRGAWAGVKASFTDETTMEDVISLLRDHNIKTHFWCMVD